MITDEERTERARLFEEYFAARHWRVVSEASGEIFAPLPDSSTATVTYDQGHFECDPPGCYRSPLGQKAREGWLVREVSSGGVDLEAVAAFPLATLEHANLVHPGSVLGLPPAVRSSE